MADPNVPTPEPQTPPPTELAAPSDAPAAPALTIEVVQAMIAEATKKAHDAGAAAARRAIEERQPKKPSTSTKPQDPPSGDVAAPEDPEFAESLTDAIGDFSFDKEQRREIRAAARREKPEDVDAFVAKWARMFGKTGGQQPATQVQPQAAPTPNQQAQKPAGPPNPSMPAPGAAPSQDGAGSVFRAMSDEIAQDTWQAYIRRKGAAPGDPYSPKNRAAWRELRTQFEREAAISSVRLGARRG